MFPESSHKAEGGVAPAVPPQLLISSRAAIDIAARRRLREEAGQGGEGAGGATASPPWYCAPGAGVLAVSPRPGDAVVFWDYVPREGAGALAVGNGASMHGGCPVLEGEKFIATRWIRAAKFS